MTTVLGATDDVAFLQGAAELRAELEEQVKHDTLSESCNNEKWVEFSASSNLSPQIDCLDLGQVRLTKEEPKGTDALLNSRVNTGRVSARAPARRGAVQVGSESPVQVHVERPDAGIIRYGSRSRQSAARVRAVHQIGACGTSLGDFFHPCGLAQLSNGHLVVADQRNNRVQILEENGSFVQMFGNEGSGVREFKSPGDIAVDAQDNIFVLDTRNDRIQVFSADGRFKRIIGESGRGPGQFSKPQGIAVTDAGEVLVADSGNNRIQVVTTEGRFSHFFGVEGSGEGEFMEPCGVAVHGAEVFVCDHHSHRVQVFRLSGEFRFAFGTFGSEHGQLSYPSSVAVAPNGSVVVSEYGNDRLSVFDSFGRFKMCFGEEGNDLGQFLSPNGVSICNQEHRSSSLKFYICDAWNHRLQMLEMIV